jgi:hypothetical protein
MYRVKHALIRFFDSIHKTCAKHRSHAIIGSTDVLKAVLNWIPCSGLLYGHIFYAYT